jgi:hypothetical protein
MAFLFLSLTVCHANFLAICSSRIFRYRWNDDDFEDALEGLFILVQGVKLLGHRHPQFAADFRLSTG